MIPDMSASRYSDSGTSISWPPLGRLEFSRHPNTLLHKRLHITVTTDPNLNSIVVNWYGNEKMINHYIAGHGPAIVNTTPTIIRVADSRR